MERMFKVVCSPAKTQRHNWLWYSFKSVREIHKLAHKTYRKEILCSKKTTKN